MHIIEIIMYSIAFIWTIIALVTAIRLRLEYNRARKIKAMNSIPIDVKNFIKDTDLINIIQSDNVHKYTSEKLSNNISRIQKQSSSELVPRRNEILIKNETIDMNTIMDDFRSILGTIPDDRRQPSTDRLFWPSGLSLMYRKHSARNH